MRVLTANAASREIKLNFEIEGVPDPFFPALFSTTDNNRLNSYTN